MGLSCGARTLKFCLFIFNLVFLICGIFCLCISGWLILDKTAVDNLAAATAKIQGYEKDDGLRDLASKPTAVRKIGFALLIGGFIVIIVSFLGCCGAAKEWRIFLCCYATCLMLILTLEITAAIYAAAHSQRNGNNFREMLRTSIRMYNGTDIQRIRGEDYGIFMKSAWDKFMMEKSCCGIDSAVGEFHSSGWYQLTGKLYDFPPACCPPKRNGFLFAVCPNISRYSQGCYEKIKESLQDLSNHFVVAKWTAGLVSLVQIFGIIVAFCLCNAISIEYY